MTYVKCSRGRKQNKYRCQRAVVMPELIHSAARLLHGSKQREGGRQEMDPLGNGLCAARWTPDRDEVGGGAGCCIIQGPRVDLLFPLPGVLQDRSRDRPPPMNNQLMGSYTFSEHLLSLTVRRLGLMIKKLCLHKHGLSFYYQILSLLCSVCRQCQPTSSQPDVHTCLQMFNVVNFLAE